MAAPGESKYVTLVSCDGFEFVVLREAACTSGAIKRMLDATSGWEESQTGICHFDEINGIVLEKVAEYFCYNYKYRNSESVPDMEIPPRVVPGVVDGSRLPGHIMRFTSRQPDGYDGVYDYLG